MTLTPTQSFQNLSRDSVVAYTDYTLATITSTGLLQISYSSAPGWGSNAGTLIGPWDAGGKVGGDLTCSGNVYAGIGGYFLGFCDQSNAAPQDTWSVHAVLQGTVRVGWDRGPVTSTGFCDGPSLPPCYTYSGSHTVKITPETVDFDVTATPSTVNYKDTVAVTITVSPAEAYGLTIPWKVDSTKWVPAFGTQTAPCQWSDFAVVDAGTRRCRKPFTRSGTLTVYTTVNGAKASKALAITVTPPTLKVTAAPPYLAGAQAVTFTATLNPSGVTWNVSQWLFIPDSGAINSGISPSPCQWTDNPCTRTISKSGWMKATATVGEYPLADSMRVSVVPCLTGDSLLDDSRLRRALNAAFNGSNPNDPSPWNRVERGGARIQRPNGSIVDTLLPIGPNDTPCSFGFPNLGQIGVPLAGWHIHPFLPADPSDPLPYAAGQSPPSTCPQLANKQPPPPGMVYTGKPGPSTEDFQLTGGLPHIVVDKANVWVIDPNGAVRQFPRNQAREM